MEPEQATRLDTKCSARFRFKKNAKNPDNVMSKIRYANFYKRAVARNEIDDYGLLVKGAHDSNGTFFENTAAGLPAKTHLIAVVPTLKSSLDLLTFKMLISC